MHTTQVLESRKKLKKREISVSSGSYVHPFVMFYVKDYASEEQQQQRKMQYVLHDFCIYGQGTH